MESAFVISGHIGQCDVEIEDRNTGAWERCPNGGRRLNVNTTEGTRSICLCPDHAKLKLEEVQVNE